MSEFKAKDLSSIPAFIYHGASDDLLPVVQTMKTYEALKDMYSSNPNNFTLNIQPKMGHSVSPQEIRLLKEWVNKVMK